MDAVAGVAVGTLEKLEIVDDDEAEIVFVGKTTGFVAKLENGHGRSIVDIERSFAHFAHGVADFGEIFVTNVAGADFPVVDAGDVGNHAVDNFGFGHFHREEEDSFFVDGGGVIGDVFGESGFTHGWASADDDEIAFLEAGGLFVEVAEAGF